MLTASQIAGLRAAVGEDGLIIGQSQLQTYECDGLTNFRVMPEAVVLPRSAEQVQAVVRLCAQDRIPFVSRGAGTGLSGGALPAAGGIVISLARMNRILNVDLANRQVVVEPGVINAHVTQRVSAQGYFYAPDPSSQSVCTIGGNVAENSGGAHCLKYGFTVTHVLALDVVLPSGELVQLGSPTLDTPGYDLPGVFVGSEGTLGVATKITLRVVKRPEVVQTLLAAFDSIQAAGQTVSDIIAARMLPAAMEIMDALSIEAAEAAVHAHYPVCKGLLLVELDGPCSEVEALMRAVQDICRQQWRMGNSRGPIGTGARFGLEGAQGRLRRHWTHLAQLHRAGRRHSAHCASAPFGRNWPIGFRGRSARSQCLPCRRWQSASAGALRSGRFAARKRKRSNSLIASCSLCVDNGGSITGEHGVGKEKQEALGYMFSEPDLATMQLVRCAFDPENIANPDKIFPRPRLCAEKPGPYAPHPLETAGIAEIF